MRAAPTGSRGTRARRDIALHSHRRQRQRRELRVRFASVASYAGRHDLRHARELERRHARRGPARSARRCARRCCFDSSVPRRTMMPIIWLVMSNARLEVRRVARAESSRRRRSADRRPCSRARSTGRLSTSPPSTSRRPSISTGVSTPGADMLARSTVTRSPLRQHDGLARLEVGRERAKRRRQRSKSCTSATRTRRRAQRLRDLLALHEAERQHHALVGAHAERAAREDVAIVLLAAIGEVAARRAVADHFLPVELAETPARSRCRSSPPHRARRPPRPCSCRRPHRSGCACSSSARMTPTCAPPRAPPPLSTRPMRARRGRRCRRDLRRGRRRRQGRRRRACRPQRCRHRDSSRMQAQCAALAHRGAVESHVHRGRSGDQWRGW